MREVKSPREGEQEFRFDTAYGEDDIVLRLTPNRVTIGLDNGDDDAFLSCDQVRELFGVLSRWLGNRK
jgi:hypothetical protein